MSEDDLIPLNLILIGKTGVGKSACGNSILQRPDAFISSCGPFLVTVDVTCELAEHSGYRIKVVDTPGLLSGERTVEETAEDMSKAISMCDFGVHAFLFVIRDTYRFDRENVETIEILKDILKKETVKKHWIIVISHGEHLDMGLGKSGLTFEKWCKQAGGSLGQLFKECNYRCVPFYNRGRQYESERQQSVQKLLSMVVKMITTTGFYKHEQF